MYKIMETDQTLRRTILSLAKQQVAVLELFEAELSKTERALSNEQVVEEELRNTIINQEKRINSFCAKIDDLDEQLRQERQKVKNQKEMLQKEFEKNEKKKGRRKK